MTVERDPLPIIDAHHHLWDLDGPIRYPFLMKHQDSFLGDYAAMRRSYMPPEYRRDSALHNVIATVHLETECDRTQQVEETVFIEDVHRRYGMPNAIVAHAWVDTPDAEEIIARQASHAMVRGIRTKPVTGKSPKDSVRGEKRSIQDPAWRKGMELLPKHGLSWDLRLPYWHLEEGADLISDLPEFPIVLNHAGYPWDRSPEALAVWRRGMRALAAHPHVHCKISALIIHGEAWTYEKQKPIIDEVIDVFGVERCMFGSNFPVDMLLGSWDYIYFNFKKAVAHLPRAEQVALFAGNAKRFYRMDDVSVPE